MRSPAVLDTVVLSNYAASDSIETLEAVLDRPVTVPAVRRELQRGSEEGYQFTRRALDELERSIPVVEPDEGLAVRFGQDLDSGEAGVLAAAIHRGGTAATDDRPARRLARAQDVPVTGSIGVLVHAIQAGELSSRTADQWIDRWVEVAGYYSPVDSIEELL